MRFVDSRCIHCGATLRVASDATHVCCQYCHAELLVARDGDRVSTELVRAMQENIGQKLDVLRVQNELERLDREWNLQREQFMVSGKNGSRSVPTIVGSWLGGIFFAGIGIYWTILTSRSTAPWPFALFGIVFIGISVFIAITGIRTASAHETAETQYQAARRKLVHELARVERPNKLPRAQLP